MFKLLAIFALVAAVSAAPGFPLAYAPAPLLHHAPFVAAPALAYHAHVVKPIVPLATSYAHQYRVDYKAPLIAAPLAYSPYAYAHAPLLKTFIH